MVEKTQFPENNNTPSDKEVIASKVEEVLKKDTYTVESLTSDSPELTPEVLEEISDFFRYTFNNVFPEYLVCMDCSKQISAPQAFGKEKEYVALEDMDKDFGELCCPRCYEEEMEIFHDKETVLRKIQKNLGENAHVSLMRNETNQDLEGITFAYFDTFENAFEKEWSNEYLYMKEQDSKFDRDGEHFLQKINEILQEKQWGEITEESYVLCWNCLAINPDAQGLPNMLPLVSNLFSNIEQKQQIEDTLFVLETRTGSTAHELLKLCGAIDVLNVFDDKGQAFLVGKAKEMASNLQVPLREFIRFLKEQKRL